MKTDTAHCLVIRQSHQYRAESVDAVARPNKDAASPLQDYLFNDDLHQDMLDAFGIRSSLLHSLNLKGCT